MEERALCLAICTVAQGRKKTLKVGSRGGVATKGTSGFISNESDLVGIVA
jgi:hypothetical protein